MTRVKTSRLDGNTAEDGSAAASETIGKRSTMVRYRSGLHGGTVVAIMVAIITVATDVSIFLCGGDRQAGVFVTLFMLGVAGLFLLLSQQRVDIDSVTGEFRLCSVSTLFRRKAFHAADVIDIVYSETSGKYGGIKLYIELKPSARGGRRVLTVLRDPMSIRPVGPDWPMFVAVVAALRAHRPDLHVHGLPSYYDGPMK
jgi:hypothetical protein